MLKGKELGKAIEVAIEKKIASGAVRSKADIARHFGIKAPSIHDWIKKGSISKDKLQELWRYFSDVVDHEHWGLTGMSATIAAKPNFSGNLSAGPDVVGQIPLISWVQAGLFCTSPDLFAPGDAERWMPAFIGSDDVPWDIRAQRFNCYSSIGGILNANANSLT